ncbi:unnamed protein product [Larinioides sclopetarius]|uniref:Uncharacterized protein n=1 Tax=Larinioides sclopetarius TaxID=280406 RepID=A0AAV2AFI4_9ARAC
MFQYAGIYSEGSYDKDFCLSFKYPTALHFEPWVHFEHLDGKQLRHPVNEDEGKPTTSRFLAIDAAR